MRTKAKSDELVAEPAFDAGMMPVETPKKKTGFGMVLGLTLLLLGGLAHMLPEQMAPLLRWAVGGVTLQMAVGTLSIVVALYYLLGD